MDLSGNPKNRSDTGERSSERSKTEDDSKARRKAGFVLFDKKIDAGRVGQEHQLWRDFMGLTADDGGSPTPRSARWVQTAKEAEERRLRGITEADTEIMELDGISDDARSNMRGLKWFLGIVLVVSVVGSVIAYYFFNQPTPAP
jgi:hypothetical protein